MKIVIFGNNNHSTELFSNTKEVLESLGLDSFISLESIDSEEYKKRLEIKSEVAFCIEEDSIGFEDVIFEGKTVTKEELTGLMISIVGGGDSGGCSSSCSACSGCH